jgi:virginiamycin B lyase
VSTRSRSLLVAAAAALLAASVLPVADAAPAFTLKQFKIPTANSSPMSITTGSDGNFWFTESHVNSQNANHAIGRITPAGSVTEFVVCNFCFPNDIVQGPDGILYFTRNDAPLGRIRTTGEVLPIAGEMFQFNGNGLAAHGDDIWVTDFNNDAIQRYDIPSGTFTPYPIPTPDANPFDVDVDAGGTVWFTEAHAAGSIARLDPATGAVTEFDVPGLPRQLAIAADGAVWFTERFDPQGVGRFDPVTERVTIFPLTAVGPEDIAAAPDGSMWFTESTGDRVVNITAAGVITEGRTVKGSEPVGITVAPDGAAWYTMLSANKIASLRPASVTAISGEAEPAARPLLRSRP